MKFKILATACIALAVTATSARVVYSAPPPAAGADHLVLVSSTQLRRVYVAPRVDMRRFRSVILDPTEVSFAPNWVRDFNLSRRGRGRMTDADAERIKNEVSTGLGDTFARALQRAGYQIVQNPGADVLRVHAKVANLAITAPTNATPGRSTTFARSAGEATLILEVRDSRDNVLLARAFDRRIAGDTRMAMRNSVTNRSDFRRVAEIWARATVEDLDAIKAASTARPAAQPGGR